nr:MAG TPA: YadA-like protein [Bacteriophage sp.]
MNKSKLILTFAVASCIGGTAFAANIDNSVGGNAGDYNAVNSLFIGQDHTINVASAGFAPAKNVAMLGDDNHLHPDVSSALVTGHNNNINASYTVTGGMHNTIHKEATYALTAGWQNSNAGNSSLVVGHTNAVRKANNTLAFGFNNKIENGADNSFVGGESSVIDGKNAFAFGENAEAKTSNVYAIGKEAVAGAENTVAIGNKAKATINDSVALGSYSIMNTVQGTSSTMINNKTYAFAGGVPVGTVSIGDVNKERTITNVAAGRISEESTDAINGSQLHVVVTEVTNNTNSIKDLDNKISDVASNTIKEASQYTDSQVARIGAQSAALAGLHPLDFNKDDKASYAASVGRYRNANAVAVGAFYRPNERTMVSGAVSFGKHIQMNLGVAFKTGKGSEYINETKSKDNRIEKLEALVEKLTAEVAELKVNK